MAALSSDCDIKVAVAGIKFANPRFKRHEFSSCGVFSDMVSLAPECGAVRSQNVS
jgi:hypothetical protein